jgi:hypothetical protein
MKELNNFTYTIHRKLGLDYINGKQICTKILEYQKTYVLEKEIISVIENVL